MTGNPLGGFTINLLSPPLILRHLGPVFLPVLGLTERLAKGTLSHLR